MFDKNNEDRLREWVEFRKKLEASSDPIQDTVTKYNNAPMVNIQVDPYDKDSWLNPWQLLNENQYCNFARLLGIFYTLNLTTKFSKAPAEIHISKDPKNSEVLYLLYFDNKVIGYDFEKAVDIEDLPKNLSTEITYTLN
jgi:hypothetical protein|tara:strand:- start:638 stop:1054 length:417 start_codon:yes stop_codon:yes gene_type:complete